MAPNNKSTSMNLKSSYFSNLKLRFQKLQLSGLFADYVLVMLDCAPFEEGTINLNSDNVGKN
jgi:hypothetical protein